MYVCPYGPVKRAWANASNLTWAAWPNWPAHVSELTYSLGYRISTGLSSYNNVYVNPFIRGVAPARWIAIFVNRGLGF